VCSLATAGTVKVARGYSVLNCTLKQLSPIVVVHGIENQGLFQLLIRMMKPKRALPELSFNKLTIILCPVVIKLLASNITIGMYGQTMPTTLGPNEVKLCLSDGNQSCFTKILLNWL